MANPEVNQTRTVYILGAGASNFAGFPLGKHLLPFLRSELGKSNDLIVRDLGMYALDFVEKVKPLLPEEHVLPTGEPDIEFVLSLAERDRKNANNVPEYRRLIKDLDIISGQLDLGAWNLPMVKQGFKTLVSSAFQYKSYLLLDNDTTTAHEDFVTISAAWAKRLNPGDSLITFNWDLLQEILLWRAGKWTYEGGYGVQTTLKKHPIASPINILKLHGSCNWALSHIDDSHLRIDYTDVFFGAQNHGFQALNRLGSTSDYGDSLIVPSYLKDPSRVKVLNSVWKSAEYILEKADSLVIMGYSLPKADVTANRLFSSMAQLNTTLRSITLVLGDDEEGFDRWETVLGDYRSICKRVRQKFEEFIRFN